MNIFLGLANASKSYRKTRLKIDTETIIDLIASGTLDGLDTAESYDNLKLLKDIGIKKPNLDLTSKIGLKKHMNTDLLKATISLMSDTYKIENGFDLLIHDSKLDMIDEWAKYRDVFETMLDQKLIRSFGLSAYLPYELDYFLRVFPFATTFQIPRNLFTQKLNFAAHEGNNSTIGPLKFYHRSIFAGGNSFRILSSLIRHSPSNTMPMALQGLSDEELFIEISANYQRKFPESNLIIGLNSLNQLIQTVDFLKRDRHDFLIEIENVLRNSSEGLWDLRRVG